MGNAVVNIATRLAGALFTLIAATRVDQAELGLLFIGVGLVTLASSFVTLGVPSALNYFTTLHIVEDRGSNLSSHLWAAILIVGTTSFLSSLLLWLFSDWVAYNAYSDPNASRFIQLAALAIPAFSLSVLACGVLQGMQRTVLAMFIQTSLWRISHLFFLLCTIFFGLSIVDLMFGISVVPLLMLLFSAYAIRRILMVWPQPITGGERRRFVRYAMNSWSSSLASVANSRADMVILGMFVITSSLPVFALAATVASLLLLSDSVLSPTFRPVATRLIVSGDDEEFTHLYCKIIRFNMLLVAPLAIYVGVFADEIVFTFFGEAYSDAAGLLRIFLLGVLPRALMGPATAALLAMGREDLVRNIDLTTTIAYVAVFSALSYLFGLEGAAVAASFYGFSQHALKNLLVRRFYQIPWISGTALVYLNIVTMFALGYLQISRVLNLNVTLGWIPFFVSFAVTTAATALLTKMMSLSELASAWQRVSSWRA